MACGACNILKRKCTEDCVFAQYFCSENMGVEKFSAIHKIFGASNFSKMLEEVPVYKRPDAVDTIYYEAECRMNNPVQGCLTNVFALQKEVYQLPFSTFHFFLFMKVNIHIYTAFYHILKSLLHVR